VALTHHPGETPSPPSLTRACLLRPYHHHYSCHNREIISRLCNIRFPLTKNPPIFLPLKVQRCDLIERSHVSHPITASTVHQIQAREVHYCDRYFHLPLSFFMTLHLHQRNVQHIMALHIFPGLAKKRLTTPLLLSCMLSQATRRLT